MKLSILITLLGLMLGAVALAEDTQMCLDLAQTKFKEAWVECSRSSSDEAYRKCLLTLQAKLGIDTVNCIPVPEHSGKPYKPTGAWCQSNAECSTGVCKAEVDVNRRYCL